MTYVDEALKQLYQASTPGLWVARDNQILVVSEDKETLIATAPEDNWQTNANLQLIASAVNHVQRYIRDIQDLREILLKTYSRLQGVVISMEGRV